MKRLIILTIAMIVISMSFLTILPQNARAAEYIEAPTWEEDDQWCMGFFEEFDESDLMGSENDYVDMSDYGDFDIGGSIGFYQAITVEDADDMSTGEKCYKTKLEQYYGAVARIKMNMDYSESYEGISMDMEMSANGYIWFEMDVIGYIFFTVEDLAVAREEVEITANADINLDMHYSYDMSGSGYSDSMSADMKISAQITDLLVDFDVDFDPALDIFDFPIEPYESWSASSEMTLTLNKISGTISYNYDIDVPGEASESDSGTETFGSDLNLPDSYTQDVYYYFDNMGTANVGTYKDCIKIEGYESYYYNYDDYYDDYYYTRAVDTGSGSGYEEDYYYEEEESSFLDPSDFSELDAEAMGEMNPLGSMTEGKNYYSPDAGMVVKSEMEGMGEDIMPDSDIMGGMGGMFGAGSGALEDMTMEPVEYSEVTDFKTTKRDEQKKEYEEIKAGEKEEDKPFWEEPLYLFMIIAVIIVVVLVVAALVISRRKKRMGPPQQMPPPPGYHQPPPPQSTQQGDYYYDQQQPPPPPPDRGSYPPPPPSPPPQYDYYQQPPPPPSPPPQYDYYQRPPPPPRY